MSFQNFCYGIVAVAGISLALSGKSPPAPPAPYPPTPEALRFAAAEAAYPFHNASIELPAGDRQFQGSGSEVANANCLSCHSAGMVLNQPPLSRAVWEEEVRKMRTAYHAPVAEADVEPIAEYLASLPRP